MNVQGNITANGGIVAMFVGDDVNSVVLHCKGTFSTINCSFEASLDSTNGTNGTWFGVQAARSNANTAEGATGNLSAAPAYSWDFSCGGYLWVRVRATAYTSGTQTWIMRGSDKACESAPTIPITGITNTTTPALPTAHTLSSAATTNGTVVKASAGTVYAVAVSNTNAAARFLKLYNSATVTVGTTVPVLTIAIPATSVVHVNFGALGMRFGTGICISMTAAAADSDTTAVAANEVKSCISYI